MASELRDTPPSTIQGWMERGIVPIRRAPEIIAASQGLPVPVTAIDFVPRAGDDEPMAVAAPDMTPDHLLHPEPIKPEAA